jgi:CRP-like cAMP-binding protein
VFVHVVCGTKVKSAALEKVQMDESLDAHYVVWGNDHSAYGPVDLVTLVSWVKDERVTAGSWVFNSKNDSWLQAVAMPELGSFFQPTVSARQISSPGPPPAQPLSPSVLRGFKTLAGLSDEQLARFAASLETARVPAGSVVIQQGQRNDAVFLVLEGRVTVRLEVVGQAAILTTLGPGDFFGDIAFLDHGPRSADVVAEADSLLATMSPANFKALTSQSPDLAAPLLRVLDQALTARIRADNQRYTNSLRTAAGRS